MCAGGGGGGGGRGAGREQSGAKFKTARKPTKEPHAPTPPPKRFLYEKYEATSAFRHIFKVQFIRFWLLQFCALIIRIYGYSKEDFGLWILWIIRVGGQRVCCRQ